MKKFISFLLAFISVIAFIVGVIALIDYYTGGSISDMFGKGAAKDQEGDGEEPTRRHYTRLTLPKD
ncbi:MAG: hypothetical protein K5662_04870 [Lachnospiraceae bacterium]|nr:hypothetical protein [Lachnospiraceae bacterium]